MGWSEIKYSVFDGKKRGALDRSDHIMLLNQM